MPSVASLCEVNFDTEPYFVPLTKVQRWLLNVGFVIEGIGGDYEKNPIGAETDRAIIWATKVLY